MTGVALGEALALLAAAVDAGRMTIAEGEAATRARIVPLLAPDPVAAAARTESERAIDATAAPSLTWWRLLFAAIERADAAGRPPLERAATPPYLYAATVACGAIPDGRVFADAVARGEAAADAALAAEETFEASECLHRLGILHLDPFVVGRTPDTFAVEDHRWRERLADSLGRHVASEPGAAMPTAEDALARAERYLERALTVRAGRPRGFTLKALCNTLLWREHLGGAVDHPRIAALASEALPLLPERYHAEMTAFAAHFGGGDPGAGAAAALLAEDVGDLVARLGPRAAIDRVRVLAAASVQAAPVELCALILRLWPALGGDDLAGDRLALARTFASAALNLAERHGCALANDGDLSTAAARLDGAAAREGWSAFEDLVARIGMAASAQRLDREEDAVPLLAALAERVAGVEPLREIVALLEAGFRQGAGVNAWQRGDMVEATASYLRACIRYALEGQRDAALHALSGAGDAAARDPAAHPVMIHGLAQAGVAIARRGTPATAAQLRRTWDRAIANLLDGGGALDLATILVALQSAKGGALAVRMAGGGHDWRSDADALAMLDAIAVLRTRGPRPAYPPLIGDNVLLASFDSDVASDAPGEAGQLLRLEERFDRHLAARAFDRVALDRALIGDDELRALIGPDTVLVSQYVGETAGGSLAILTVLLTDTESHVAIGVAPVPAASIALAADGRRVEANWFTLPVAELRDGIEAEPEGGIVSAGGAAALASLSAQLLGGGVTSRLDEWRAGGRTHLCFHPHEALHTLPLHLLGNDAPLADDWIVSTIPHPAALRRRAARPSEGLASVTAIGLGYEGGMPHDLPALAGAEDEARAVAAALGGIVRTGENATEASVLAALRTSRRVHVACHGAMEAGAPAFQRLYLHPADGGDGILHAYEIDGLDLGHVDLVTLSACETALGRFDALDNQRGLTANLLAAGVATIVSTLWPVLDETAALFFPHLYDRIGAGDGKRAAFRSAQRAVRERYPEYRDWGAFQYSGAW